MKSLTLVPVCKMPLHFAPLLPIDIDEPILTKARIDMLEPMCSLPRIELAPTRANDLILSELPPNR
jgi:hypothetical protein